MEIIFTDNAYELYANFETKTGFIIESAHYERELPMIRTYDNIMTVAFKLVKAGFTVKTGR